MPKGGGPRSGGGGPKYNPEGHQGFALAGLHLGDAALVEDDAAHQLHPVGPEAQHPQKIFGDYSSRELKSITPIADKIEAMADEYKAMSDAQLQAKTQEFKDRLQNGETLDDME